MPDTFGITKDGIQIPYRRFLADSAAGFLIVLIACLSYYWPLGGFAAWHGHASLSMPTEVRILIFVLLFVLATPLGFAVNAASWFMVEQATAAIEQHYFARCAKRPWT